MSIIGIDLGTTNSLATCFRDGKVVFLPNSQGSFLTPSVVSVLENGEILVGQAAKERMLTQKETTAASFKRFMGMKKQYSLGEHCFTPAELSALVLKKLKQDAQEYLKEPVESCIVTVPAYFNDKQRKDTRLAAELAGLHVERIINEPSAAALAYYRESGKEEACFLVFDFGGGTLDISLVECFDNVIEIEAVAGDNALGGDDVDTLLLQHVLKKQSLSGELSLEELSVLQREIEAAKRRLMGEEETKISCRLGEKKVDEVVNRKQLLELCLPLLERIRKLFLRVLRDGGCTFEEIDAVILVGGSSQLPFIAPFIEELSGKPPIAMEDMDRVVAKGVGTYVGIRMRQEDIRDMMMTDVCPFTLGTSVCWDKKDERAHILPILERNCPLPFSKTVILTTLSDYQSVMNIGIYQGEEYYADENVCLGEFRIMIRPKPAGIEKVTLTFSYDINGVLQVEAENSMNEKKQMLLTNDGLEKEEVEEKLKLFEQLKLPDQEEEEYQELLSHAMWLYEQLTGELRQRTAILIHQLQQTREEKRHRPYQAAKEMLLLFFEEIEKKEIGEALH